MPDVKVSPATPIDQPVPSTRARGAKKGVNLGRYKSKIDKEVLAAMTAEELIMLVEDRADREQAAYEAAKAGGTADSSISAAYLSSRHALTAVRAVLAEASTCEGVKQAAKERIEKPAEELPASSRRAKRLAAYDNSGLARAVPGIAAGYGMAPTETQKEVKETIVDTFYRIGGVEAYAKWARENPGKFYEQYVKILPLEIKGSIHVAGEFTSILASARTRASALRSQDEPIDAEVVYEEVNHG